MSYRRRPAPIMLIPNNAKLSGDWGYAYACRLFGTEAIESLPKLKSGPNKGKTAGYLCWRKASKAGWIRECQSVRGANDLVDAWIGVGPLSQRDGAVPGLWYGRTQQLAGSYSVLGQEARDRHAAEQAREDARWAEERAEMQDAMQALKAAAQ